jgi:integrin beta 3
VRLPGVLDRGVFTAAGLYSKGDGVTWEGSFWIAQRAVGAGETPGDNSGAWRLAVKKGRPGRDGSRGEKGERGAAGRDGQNALVQGPGF